MKNMRNVYAKMNTEALRELRSKKQVRLAKLRAQPMGYFIKREIEALNAQTHWIDVELTCRFQQMELL